MMKTHVLLGVVAASLGACAAAYPPQPQVVGTPLPPSGTVAGIEGYAQAVGGYLTASVGETDGDVARANQGYISTLMEDPDNAELRDRVFESSLLAGDIPTALRMAKSMPEGTETNAMPALVRAVGEIRAGHVKEARRIMRGGVLAAAELMPFRVMESYLAVAEGRPVKDEVNDLLALPGSAAIQSRKLYHAARLWLKAGDQNAAISMLEAANVLEPGGLFTTLLLGNLYENSGRPDEALALYRVFREKNPQVTLLQNAERRVAEGKLPPVFASTLEEDSAAALFDFGLMVWAQGAITPARELMNLALWLDPADPHMLYYAAIVEEFAGADDIALTRYNAIPTESAAGLAARVREAELNFRAAKPGDKARADALAALRKLVRQNPDTFALRTSLAELSFDDHDYKSALAEYDALLKSGAFEGKPTLLSALHFARGATFERLGRYDEATKDLQTSLGYQPNNPNVLNYLGYMWAEQGINLPEAVKLLQKAIALAPEDGAIVDSLGWAYFKSGEQEKALTYLEKAGDMAPDDPSVAEHLGDVYAKQGDKAEANRHWRRALQLNKEADWPDEELARRVNRKLN